MGVDMKILVLAKAYPPETGGVETYSEQVALAYVRAGHDVTVVTAHPGVIGTETRGGVVVINVGQQGGQSGVFRRMLMQLWKLRGEKYDLLHATTWRVALPGLVMRRKLPMVVTIHGREVFVVPIPLRPLMRIVFRHARYFPTISQPILDKLESDLGVELQGAFANWNGISFEVESRQPHDKPEAIQIFCMCRLVRRKNVDGAIRAVAELIARGHKASFLIAGGGPEAVRLAALIDDLNMADHIKLLGRVPDDNVAPLYRSSQIFLHPQIATRNGQDMEGFGLTIADGMAFGCVPVAGASGGPLDFIRDGETGFLVDGTDISAITGSLEALFRDSDQMSRMAKAAHEFAHGALTWDTHVKNILTHVHA
jgi:glycosyltransferase involved in cell wall biosynthesis